METPRIYTFKQEPGKPYRPSNGTAGDLFESWFCRDCKHDHRAHMDGDFENGCPILATTLAIPRADDPLYPKEWVIADDGYPMCTAFESDGCVSGETTDSIEVVGLTKETK